jgi:hypothetical protein
MDSGRIINKHRPVARVDNVETNFFCNSRLKELNYGPSV